MEAASLWTPLPRYQAKQVRVGRRRFYRVEGPSEEAVEGLHYTGVTSILSATKPPEARRSLQRWRQRVGAETANQITASASASGIRIHKYIEAFLGGEVIPETLDANGFWQSIRPVLSEVEAPLLLEGAVWHEAGFIGFPDALVVYNGQLCLCDWKTARKPKRREWIADYFLQVAAYVQAVNYVYQDYGIEVQRALVAIALDDQPAQLFPLDSAELTHHWQSFQRRLQTYRQRYSSRIDD